MTRPHSAQGHAAAGRYYGRHRFQNPLAYYRAGFQFWRFMALSAHGLWLVAALSYLSNVWAAQQ